MRLLVVGGAGYVGSILRPALESHHDCRYFDLRPVPGAEDRCMVGDLNHDDTVALAVREPVDALIWVAMGVKPGVRHGEHDLDSAFDVNVRGFYRVLAAAAERGVRRFVYASSMSVYGSLGDPARYPMTEDTPLLAWDAYGTSKRLGESIGKALTDKYPDAVFISLRLMWPRNDQDWPGNEYTPGRNWYALGPNDLRRLFLAAVELDKCGFHAFMTTGDLGGQAFSNALASRILGWHPESR